MTNIITDLQQRNKELSNQIAELEKQISSKEQEFKQLNNKEIREWIISILSNDYSASDMDEKAIDMVMCHWNQESWTNFCRLYPTEPVRRTHILYVYKFNHYYNLTNKLYGVRNDARYHILINLFKLNSEESKDLFRKWLREGKLEDSLTLKEFLEEGYKSDSISQSCYSYLDIRHLSLDELISSWNELTANAFKQKQEYSEKVAELESKNKGLETKVNEKDDQIEELEERVEIEQEMSMKALDKAEEWHERKNFEIAMQKDVFIFNQQQTIEKLRKDLDARDEKIAKLTKPKKFQQLRKLANKTKEKISTKVNIIKESVKKKEQKFQAYILQQFETHVLKQ